MIRYYDGTVFNAGADAIVNTVNCTGVMGAGIALEFKLRYPKMFEDYKAKCDMGLYLPGEVNYYADNDISIVNFSTKWHFKYPSKIEWVENGLRHFCDTYKEHGITSIAFPRLGTSNGGLDWKDVKPLMEKYLSTVDAEVIICLDSLPYAEGIEKEMLDSFNAMSIDTIASNIKLNKVQKQNIEKGMPYNRFWKIAKTEKVGAKTYENIFAFYYKGALCKKPVDEQLDMFSMIEAVNNL